MCLARVDFPDPFRHDFRLELPDGFHGGGNLTVDIGETDPVVINQVQRADSAAGEPFADISPHAADAENGNPGPEKPVHALRPQQQACAGKLVLHRRFLSDIMIQIQTNREETSVEDL